MSFEGQIALVTGTSQGLGLELARQLATAGATVYATVRKAGDAEGGLSALDGDVHVVALDLVDPAAKMLAGSTTP